MAYNVKIFGLSPAVAGPQSVASTGVKQEHVAGSMLKVRRVTFVVTTVLGAGAVTVAITKRPIPGSATGEVALGSLAIPALTAAGTKIYKDLNSSVSIQTGESVAFNVSAAAASGAGYFLIEGEEDPETALNQSLVLSA